MHCIATQNLEHSFICSNVMEELLILKLGHVTMTTPTLGVNLLSVG